MEFEKTITMVKLEFWASEAYGRWLIFQALLRELKRGIEKEKSKES